MRVLLPVSALLLGAAFLLAGSGLQNVLLPVRAGLERFTTLDIALISSCYFAGFGVGCLYGARMVRAVGHIRTFTAMTAVAASIALVHAFFVFPPFWWILRVVTGFCLAVLSMVIESWLNERSTRETRGTVLSAYMIINLTVVTLGQLMLPLHDPQQLELFAIVAILISLAGVPVALSGALAPAPIEATRVRVGRLFAVSPTGLSACFVVGLANGPFWAFGPQFATSNGLDETGLALFMSAAVIGGALGQWPLGRLSDTGDRRRVILLAAALASAAGVLMAFRPFGTAVPLFWTAGLWGAFAFPIYSLGVAHANDHAAPGDFVETSSGLLLVYAGGAVLGPLMATVVTRSLGDDALFAYAAVVHGLLVAFVLLRSVQHAPAPDEDRVRFSDALQAATTVSPVFDSETQAELEAEAEEAVATAGPGGRDDDGHGPSGEADPVPIGPGRGGAGT